MLMIDETIMNKIIPIPTIDEVVEETKEELEEEGFAVTNFSSGGIFYTLLMICIHIHLQLLELSRKILNNMYIKHAEGDWLEIKAADYSKSRKAAVKTQGYVTLYRSDFSEIIRFNKGHMFKTKPDAQGKELKYYVLEDSIFPAGQEVIKVLVEAEQEGTSYNVSKDSITQSMIYIGGIEKITNESDWIKREGADIEELESLRNRVLGSYSELAYGTTDEKLKNIVEGVPGVLHAKINSQHPRGQGTVDIIITGTAGQASEELIKKVQETILPLKNEYEDFLVKSAEIVYQDFELVVYVSEDANLDGKKELAEMIIKDILKLNREELNTLYRDTIIAELKQRIPNYIRTVFVTPSSDVELEQDKIIMLGNLNVSVERR